VGEQSLHIGKTKKKTMHLSSVVTALALLASASASVHHVPMRKLSNGEFMR
jgi:hypothetical protein